MLFGYDEYKAACLAKPVDEERFAALAPLADAVLDSWTQGRASRAAEDGRDVPAVVATLYAAVVDALPSAVEASQGGERVTSFSNGVDSFSFDVKSVEGELESRLGWLVQALPVEWCSACVPYAEGRRVR